MSCAKRRGALDEVVNLGLCVMSELVHQARSTDASDFAQSLVHWLDQHAAPYPEIYTLVAQHKLTLLRAAEALGFEEVEESPPSKPMNPKGERQPADSALGKTTPQRIPTPEPRAACATCGGSRRCLTCGGSGMWYAGSIDEDECSSCGGSGRCPDC